jgi:hypothetical protein
MVLVVGGSGPSYLLPQGQTSVDASSTFVLQTAYTSAAGATSLGEISFNGNGLVACQTSTGTVTNLTGTIYVGVTDGVGALPLSSELPAQYIFFANDNTVTSGGLFDTQEHANYYSFSAEITAITSGIATMNLIAVNNGSNIRGLAQTTILTGTTSSGPVITCSSTSNLVVGQRIKIISGTGTITGTPVIDSITDSTHFVSSVTPSVTLSSAKLSITTPHDYRFLGVYLGPSVAIAGNLDNSQNIYAREIKQKSYATKNPDSSNVFSYNSYITPLKQALFYTPNYVVINGYPVETDGVEDTVVNGNVASTQGLAVKINVNALATGNVYNTNTYKYNTVSVARSANNVWAAQYYDENANVWSASQAYAVNDLVVYNNLMFRCKLTRSATANTPLIDTTHWEPGWYSDDTNITPASKKTYIPEATFPALNASGKNNLPAFLYSPGTTTYTYQGDWASYDTYSVNDYVMYNENTYVCIKNVSDSSLYPDQYFGYWSLIWGQTKIKKTAVSPIQSQAAVSFQDSQYLFTNYCPWAQSGNSFTVLLTGFLYNNNPSNSLVKSVLGNSDWYSVFATGKQNSGVLSKFSKTDAVVGVRYYNDGSLTLNVGEAEVARISVKNILQRPYAPVTIGLTIEKSVVGGKTLYTGTLHSYDGQYNFAKANIVGSGSGYVLSNLSNDCFILGAIPTIDPEDGSKSNYFYATTDIMEIDHYYGTGFDVREEMRKLSLIYGVNQ